MEQVECLRVYATHIHVDCSEAGLLELLENFTEVPLPEIKEGMKELSSPLRTGAASVRSEVLVDPFFQDVPWDLIYNDSGELIGEVYVLLGAARREGEVRRKSWG